MANKTICIVYIKEEQFSKNLFSLVSKARELNVYHKYKILVVVVGKLMEDERKKLFHSGAEKIICCKVERDKLIKYDEVLVDIIKREYSSLVIFPSYDKDRECAARLATNISAGLTAECIDIRNYNQTEFVFTRAAMSDSVTADILCVNTEIAMCTVKNNMFAENFDYPLEGEYEEIDFVGKRYFTTGIDIIERKKQDIVQNIDLDNAKVVFGIGRGAKDKKNLAIINELAKKCGAIVVGTRAVVEEKILEKERQIGQSGRSINPDIYITFGISGAIQHMVGINRGTKIISINKDKNAAIFNYADYSIVGDCYEILMELKRIF